MVLLFMQLLFHVNIFRERLLQLDDLVEHSVLHEVNCLFKALISAREEPGDMVMVNVSALRTALGTFCPEEHFEEGREHEVTLALKLILNSVHLAFVAQPGEESCSCTAHKTFGLNGMEWIDCPTCGSSSGRKPYGFFSLSITSSSLLKSMKDCPDSSFCDHVKAGLLEDNFPCAADGCEEINCFSRALHSSPAVCIIGKFLFRRLTNFFAMIIY